MFHWIKFVRFLYLLCCTTSASRRRYFLLSPHICLVNNKSVLQTQFKPQSGGSLRNLCILLAVLSSICACKVDVAPDRASVLDVHFDFGREGRVNIAVGWRAVFLLLTRSTSANLSFSNLHCSLASCTKEASSFTKTSVSGRAAVALWEISSPIPLAKLTITCLDGIIICFLVGSYFFLRAESLTELER